MGFGNPHAHTLRSPASRDTLSNSRYMCLDSSLKRGGVAFGSTEYRNSKRLKGSPTRRRLVFSLRLIWLTSGEFASHPPHCLPPDPPFVFFAFLYGCVHLRQSASICRPPPGPPEKTVIDSIESTESLIAGPVLGEVRARRPRCGRRPPRRCEAPARHGAMCPSPRRPTGTGSQTERRTHDLGVHAFMSPAAFPFAFFAFLCGSVHLCQSASICGSPPPSSFCLPCPP
jgi:hypothetical protein